MPSTIQKTDYTTVRIYNQDHKKLKELAYHQDKKLVELIREAALLLDEKYDNNNEN